MSWPIFKVDAFAEKPFEGNPAGVCFLERPEPEAWMQGVAAEMNVAETAFLVPRGDAYDLRWFTPTLEVDLCGHATLASAHVLWESGRLDPSRAAEFHTKSGVLVAKMEGDAIVMNFPAEPASPAPPPPGLAEGLGVPFSFCGQNRMDYLVEVADERAVRSVYPELRSLMKIPVRGVIVTARASMPGVDFVSRFFAPAAGVDEDPVTGSAHCALAPYWAAKLGRDELAGFQASQRGGRVGVRVVGDRVDLIGRAVTVLRGTLFAAVFAVLFSSGCSIKKLAINKVGDAISSGGSTYETDEDLELVGDALPFSLKLLESLLAESPDHRGMLNAACKGFTSYGYAFVENGDRALSGPDLATEQAIKERARRLYLRAFRYGVHGLDVRYSGLSEKLTSDPKGAVAPVAKDDVEELYWCAASLGLAISVSKGDAAMIARVPEVEAMLDRAMALDSNWGEGALHEFAITLASAKPGGSDPAKLKAHYERALALSGGKRAGVYVTYAEADAVPRQDVEGFRSLLGRALAVDPDAYPQARVTNLVAQQRARWLSAHVEDYFLLPEGDAP